MAAPKAAKGIGTSPGKVDKKPPTKKILQGEAVSHVVLAAVQLTKAAAIVEASNGDMTPDDLARVKHRLKRLSKSVRNTITKDAFQDGAMALLG